MRVHGDKNLSAREKRKDAQIAALKAEVAMHKAKLRIAQARSAELREQIKAIKLAKTAR